MLMQNINQNLQRPYLNDVWRSLAHKIPIWLLCCSVCLINMLAFWVVSSRCSRRRALVPWCTPYKPVFVIRWTPMRAYLPSQFLQKFPRNFIIHWSFVITIRYTAKSRKNIKRNTTTIKWTILISQIFKCGIERHWNRKFADVLGFSLISRQLIFNVMSENGD